MNEFEIKSLSSDALQKLRGYLLESIAQAADEIKDIDRKLAVLDSQELEYDLNQAEENHGQR